MDLVSSERAACDRTMGSLRGELSDEGFAAAYADGEVMSLEEAVAFALKESSAA